MGTPGFPFHAGRGYTAPNVHAVAVPAAPTGRTNILRLGLIALLLAGIVSYILHRKGIKISLTPLGRTVLVRVAMQAIRLLLRRLGL